MNIKKAAAVAIGIIVALIGVQVAHRVLDTVGSVPVEAVQPLGAGETPAAGTSSFARSMAALTSVSLTGGHRIEILPDGGAALARLWTDILNARESIALQTYYCESGRVTDTLKTLLRGKAVAGVRVLFLRDGFGCRLPERYLDSLRESGVAVGTIRPLHWYSLHRAQHRSHVRAAVIDGTIGFTGGFGFADKWLEAEGGHWRETTARFAGAAVQQLAGAFAIAWAEATGELVAGDALFPAAAAARRDGPAAGLLYTTRTYGTAAPERYLALSLAAARHRVYITNPYFIPNRQLRDWLESAAARGVDVRVLTAASNVDVKVTRWAARSHYRELLAAGVRIYEYTPAMLHAKTMSIDGVWGTIGSLNLDNVSLRLNDEALLLVQDSAVGAALDSVFHADLALSEEVTAERFRERPWTDRVREFAARWVREFL
jgi:cardiolipin synthase